MRCYPLLRKIQQLQAGQYTVIRHGKRVRLDQSSISFRLQKSKEVLDDLRWWEMGINEPTSPLQLEACLIALVTATRAKPRWINQGIHAYLADVLTAEERRKMYPVLLDFVENLPSAKHRRPYLAWDFRRDSLF